MNQEKQSRKKSQNKRKSLVIALVLAVLAVAAVGTTLAYIKVLSDKVDNSFTLAEASVEIVEQFNGRVKSSVKVKNTGTAPAYIRAAVIANQVDAEGSITGSFDVSSYLGGTKWIAGADGYYYYTEIVPAGKKTGELLKNSIDLKDLGIQVTILAEGIQASPAGAAKDAWGVDPATGNPVVPAE